jgi:hypothetical protein
MTGFVGTVTGVTEAASGLAPIDPSAQPAAQRRRGGRSRYKRKQTSRFGIKA